MGNKVKINIKYFLGKEKSKELLLKLSKECILDTTTEELDLADMEVYSIFKPILVSIGITRNDYMSNQRLRNNYRQLLFSLYKELSGSEEITNQHQEQKEKNINIDDFGKAIHDITVFWSKLFTATREKEEINTGEYISDLSLKEFCLLDEEVREKVFKISAEENFPLDYKIYKAFKRQIVVTEDITFLEFIQNKELKEAYRHKLSFVKNALSNKNNASVTDNEALEKITHESKHWYEFLEAAESVMPNGKEVFVSLQPLETFALLTVADKHAMEEKLSKLPMARRTMENNEDNWISAFVSMSRQIEDIKEVKR